MFGKLFVFGLFIITTTGLLCYKSDTPSGNVLLVNCDKVAPGATLCVKQQLSIGEPAVKASCWKEAGDTPGCTTYDYGFGITQTRCFCNTDGCNGGMKTTTSTFILPLLLVLSFYFN